MRLLDMIFRRQPQRSANEQVHNDEIELQQAKHEETMRRVERVLELRRVERVAASRRQMMR